MKDYRQLEVWQRSHRFALAVHSVSQSFPREEAFGLTGQFRRASVSIPTNLAEGCGRDSDADFKRLVVMAHGSASEAEYELLLASDLGMLKPESYHPLRDEIDQIKRMLGALARKLKADC